MLLGEPKHIGLYLEHYPLSSSPYLLDGTDPVQKDIIQTNDSEMASSKKSVANLKDLTPERIDLHAIIEDE